MSIVQRFPIVGGFYWFREEAGKGDRDKRDV